MCCGRMYVLCTVCRVPCALCTVYCVLCTVYCVMNLICFMCANTNTFLLSHYRTISFSLDPFISQNRVLKQAHTLMADDLAPPVALCSFALLSIATWPSSSTKSKSA